MSLKMPREYELSSECNFLRSRLAEEQDKCAFIEKRLNRFCLLFLLSIIVCVLLCVFAFFYGKHQYNDGYDAGMEVGYEQGVYNTKKKYSEPLSADVTVYVTVNGTKYHEKGCMHLSNSSIPISLKEAEEQGYTPCSVCNPPAL